ncbi:hypothetical protein E3C22_20535 [Jiella endophytica]|uniref:Biotin transporter BioY n=1 Tax=Jiella endophytica TaxID=2558362 RepID=A0A4Y8RCG0_9HYPH|nr:hypothetical protein [Jiella endophytica]TFF19156.1 hypothetical protein E3C22_20535 [Jiella endophytica]
MGSAIERSLRRALAKGDAADPDFRLQIYEAAERALLRLEADKQTPEAAKEAHRRELIGAIEAIENDFAEAGPPAEAEDDAPPLGPATPGKTPADERLEAPAAEDEAAVEAQDAGHEAPEPMAADLLEDRYSDREPLNAASEDEDDEAPRRRSRAGRTLVSLVIVLLLLFLVGAAVWIVLPMLPSDDTASRGAPSTDAGGLSVAEAIRENSGTAPTADAAPEWVEVYTPEALREFAGSDDAIEDATPAGGEPVLKLMQPADAAQQDGSGAGDAGSREIELPISGDVARGFAGKKVEGEIVVGSPDGKPREFSLRCLFGGDSACGRQRFTTSLPEENFLFHLEFPPEAGTGGQIAIDPSVGAGGKDLMFYGLKLRHAS